jgi:4-amino-4-deoxy-L-arabinose transferase-like glycosyltransferase
VSSRTVWFVLAVALVARLAFVAATPNYTPIHDDHDYDRLACGIVGGAGYAAVGPNVTRSSCGNTVRDPRPTAFRAPLWPATLAGVYAVTDPLTSDRWLAGRIFNTLLGTVAVALLGFIATRLWGRRTGLLALVLGAICVPLIVIGGSLLTETPFVVLELAAIAAVVAARDSPHRLRWALLAGVLVGAASLTRTNGIVLLLPLAWALWGPAPRRSWQALAPVAVLVVACAAIIAPWTIRNASSMHDFVPVSTETGSALAGTYNHTAQHAPNFPHTWHWPKLVPELAPALRKPLSEPQRQRQLVDVALHYIEDHPTALVASVATNTGRFFGLGGPTWWRFSAHTIDVPDTAADVAVGWLALAAPLALIGVVAAWRRRGPGWLWLVPVLLLLSATVVVGETRFRAPIDPFLVLLTALGADAVLTWIRRPGGARNRLPSPASASDRGRPSPSGT